MIRDADLERTVGESTHPLMGLGVFEIRRNVAHVKSFAQVIRDLPARTNGGRTTRALSSLPRMSTCTLSPVAAGTRARAMERSSVGENVPLVISPSPTPGTRTFW